jgi:hypothetical protein
VLGGALAAACVAVVGVQAAASGQTTPKAPSSPQNAAAALRAKLASHGRATAAASVGGRATAVSCGQTLTASTTLTADLNCSASDGLSLGANGIVLNLNGHFIIGGSSHTGVNNLTHSSDTIENGYVIGFTTGVFVPGSRNTVTKLQVSAALVGIEVRGAQNQVTSNTLAENTQDGLYNNSGTGNTLKGNHLVNNGFAGLASFGFGSQISGNIANGNTNDGIFVNDPTPATLTGNTANYNNRLGIDANSPQIDGGTNAAKGNTTQAQCTGVVCS